MGEGILPLPHFSYREGDFSPGWWFFPVGFRRLDISVPDSLVVKADVAHSTYQRAEQLVVRFTKPVDFGIAAHEFANKPNVVH